MTRPSETFVCEIGGTNAHDFACAVCGEPGDCDGDCDRDPAAHVHFAEPCWETFANGPSTAEPTPSCSDGDETWPADYISDYSQADYDLDQGPQS